MTMQTMDETEAGKVICWRTLGTASVKECAGSGCAAWTVEESRFLEVRNLQDEVSILSPGTVVKLGFNLDPDAATFEIVDKAAARLIADGWRPYPNSAEVFTSPLVWPRGEIPRGHCGAPA